MKALDSKLCEWRTKLKTVPCKSVKDLQKGRSKNVVAVTFNKLGIVVPYDEKTELGYRPLPMSNSEYLSICMIPTHPSSSPSPPLLFSLPTFPSYLRPPLHYQENS